LDGATLEELLRYLLHKGARKLVRMAECFKATGRQHVDRFRLNRANQHAKTPEQKVLNHVYHLFESDPILVTERGKVLNRVDDLDCLSYQRSCIVGKLRHNVLLGLIEKEGLIGKDD
jgi:hypothetical protein